MVRAAARGDPRLVLEADRVARVGDRTLIAPSAARAAGHADAAARWRPVALAYARAVARHVPWVRAVLLSGSLASGGFDERDDLDVSIVAAPGTKHLAYVACLAVAWPFAWRHRRRAHGVESRMPLAPKLVCVNVVWTTDEATPFARRDAAMALEVALSEPVWGAAAWEEVLLANAPLVDQLAPRAGRDEIEAPRSRIARLLARLPTRPLDALAYRLARAVHAWVRWHRRKDPATRARVERIEATKHPYAILDRPPRRRHA